MFTTILILAVIAVTLGLVSLIHQACTTSSGWFTWAVFAPGLVDTLGELIKALAKVNE